MSSKNAFLALSACLGLGLSSLPGTGAASPDPAIDPSRTDLELIAFEVPGCAYCPLFRRDVAPSYAASRAGREAPLRYLDLNDAAAAGVRLSAPVTVVPTLVLVKDRVEVARISGYVGRESVFRLLAPLLPPE